MSVEPFERCIAFARSLGIDAKLSTDLSGLEFLPGIMVWQGGLTVDPSRSKGPSDVLHELGHLAILPGGFRPFASQDVDKSIAPHSMRYFDTHGLMLEDGSEDPTVRAILQAGEAEAIAWGYAAQVHLKLEPITLFLADCPDDQRDMIMLGLSMGQHFGVHGLQAAGMTTTRIYPKMLRWIQP